ncbi:unnamed protein product [Arctia plantaginis]|uniref:Uncharacterized protein n=1 Tax=Arctia plantaginis TaxID=874455 RepID=A0A8S1BBS3_ARCPL|nr:unnamed protein product [Arctia plantaginis]
MIPSNLTNRTNISQHKNQTYAAVTASPHKYTNIVEVEDTLNQVRQQPAKRKQRNSSEHITFELNSSSSESDAEAGGEMSSVAGERITTEGSLRATSTRRLRRCRRLSTTKTSEDGVEGLSFINEQHINNFETDERSKQSKPETLSKKKNHSNRF